MNFEEVKNTGKKGLGQYMPLFSIILFMAVITLAYFFIVEPFDKALAKQKQDISDRQQQLKVRQADYESFVKLKDSFSNFPDRVKDLNSFKAQQTDFEQLMAQVEKMANDSNVSVTINQSSGTMLNGVQPSTPAPVAPTGVVSYVDLPEAKIDVKGAYSDIKKFITSMENNYLIININSLSISGSSSGMTLSITVKVGS